MKGRTMKVGILGTGRMGQGLSELLRRAGHEVTLGSRTPADTPFPSSSLGVVATQNQVVVVALPHEAIEPNIEVLRTMPAETIVIDVANGVRIEDGRIRSTLEKPHGRWLAELLPQVKVARAFTHVQDELLVSRATRQPDTWAVAVAADTPDALATASDLVLSARYVPVSVGDLGRSGVLDPGGPLFPNMYLPGDMRDLIHAQGS
jgi:8-hydroxy-5-deazaflavin:NADPH oxidoreductase